MSEQNANGLSAAQMKRLVEILAGCSSNVFRTCELEFGVVVGDEVFDRLATEFSLRKCVECNVWHEFPEGDVCWDCLSEQDDD